ncbi:hypothetical protein L6452_10074 [Arctium lappa]|uniref:Uncharacterized protein n=1 Tax=Arctium lappa TaxID=4217 RepID=A0ACB9DLQ6_ARCLA|nr:hypothetical protein L6452_10074 [Arctium lappa]
MDLDTSSYPYCFSFTVVRGYIHLFMSYRGKKCKSTCRFAMVLWRMEGDGEWTKLATYNDPPIYPWWDLNGAFHMMKKNGNWVMHSRFAIYKVDIEKHSIAKLCSYAHSSLDITSGGKYMETVGIKLFN